MGDEFYAQLTTHLEFLGYAVDRQDDGWCLARHPRRYDFFFKEMRQGVVRFHAAVRIGSTADLKWRREALEAINALNEDSSIAKYTLKEDEREYGVRIRATLPGTYERGLFGDLIDLWHTELGRIDKLPGLPKAAVALPDGDDDEAVEEKSPQVVN